MLNYHKRQLNIKVYPFTVTQLLRIHLAQSDGLSACFANNFCIALTSCFVLRVIGLYGQSCPASPDAKVTEGLGADTAD